MLKIEEDKIKKKKKIKRAMKIKKVRREK